jgi:hypothetical protein
MDSPRLVLLWYCVPHVRSSCKSCKKQLCSGYVLLLVWDIKGLPWLQQQPRVAQFVSLNVRSDVSAELSLQLGVGYSFSAGVLIDALLCRHCARL